ncbi:MAG TPA: hypothetical protein VGG61_08015, partial [Gemmataceae bacterium]
MRRTPTSVLALAVVFTAATLVGRANAQQNPLLGNNLPNPRLMTILPNGGKVGTTFEVTWTGTDLEEPQELRFSVAGIKAEAVPPP